MGVASGLLQQHWLVSTAAATGCWALSDVCCDVCIGSKESSEDDASSDDDVEGRSLEEKKKAVRRVQLTPEQNAMISAWVSLAASASLALSLGARRVRGGSRRDGVIAGLAGAVHFVAYAVELRAYRTASSTVITPLLQLSAVWMTLLRAVQPLVASAMPHPSHPKDAVARGGAQVSLAVPQKDLDALYVATAAMRPAHFVAVFLVFVGGFLPAARGKVSRFADSAFYRQEAVQCCLVGELLVCVYNALLHMCTFRQALVDGDSEDDASLEQNAFLGGESDERSHAGGPLGSGTIPFLLGTTTTLESLSSSVLSSSSSSSSRRRETASEEDFFSSSSSASFWSSSAHDRPDEQVDASREDVLRFFAISRLGTFLAMALVLALGCGDGFSRRDLADLRRCDRVYLAVALLGEILSVAGVCIVMFSYATFHEPAVVNAAEGGVQQLLNLCFAVALQRCLGFGRKVDDFRTKLISFALVSAGLALSCR